MSMSTIMEAPYVATLKESFITSRCSACFKSASNKCPTCNTIVYCNEQCRTDDHLLHEFECNAYKNMMITNTQGDCVIARMIARVIARLNIDGGQPTVDLCSNVPKSIQRRTWSDLLGHRNDMFHSVRHRKMWQMTKTQMAYLFQDQFKNIDLMEIFGKILINRFRVGFVENIFNGRVAIGWAIYLTVSCFNHSCKPDLLQCSYDINMRLKFARHDRCVPETNNAFNQLTVSYRHQNDFRLHHPLSYVPTRKQRRNFVDFFFFNCHCVYCAQDLKNRFRESAANQLCTQCGDSLILQENYDDAYLNTSVLGCLGRNKCSQAGLIVDRLDISTNDNNTEQSISACEEKLAKIEEILHPQSILLVQQREKTFFAYQKLLNEHMLDENERMNHMNRAIQLGEALVHLYDIYLKYPSIYPKIFITDLANLCEQSGKIEQAKQLYQKAIDLWKFDYEGYIDYTNIHNKL